MTVDGRASDTAVRASAAQQPTIQRVLRAATALLTVDVAFFRRVRTGPFFLLARPTKRP
jgi:hypothetical protein